MKIIDVRFYQGWLYFIAQGKIDIFQYRVTLDKKQIEYSIHGHWLKTRSANVEHMALKAIAEYKALAA